jgi:predicted acylesterase/phospholipase RssA
MTGGGAKGLYEAGVINAFHITGMTFDVITGSSIGAMNSIFYAEYLLRRKQFLNEQGWGDAFPNDPGKALEVIKKMDHLINCYHHTWLQMPTEHLIDDSEKGRLSEVVKLIAGFKINLSDLVALGWWATDPKLSSVPEAKTALSVLQTLNRLIIGLGKGNGLIGLGKLIEISVKQHNRRKIMRDVLKTYLQNLGIEHSVIPSEKGEEMGTIETMFTRDVTPLKSEYLAQALLSYQKDPEDCDRLIDPNRTLKDYRKAGIDVRLTRANYRTGRLEIASYLSAEDFRRYMKKQGWRMEQADLDKMPLGSFRLQLPGNPKAIKAALASGRFPGVFAPFPFKTIYPEKDQENELLYKLVLDKEVAGSSGEEVAKVTDQDRAEIMKAVEKAYGKPLSDQEKKDWGSILDSWQKSAAMRTFFPYESDSYVDGGAIDNTPSNSAVDATREWAEAEKKRKRDVVLELYIIFLEEEPRVSRESAEAPLIYEVVQRTLAIQSAAVKTSDAVVVDTINSFGGRGEEMARGLFAVIDGLQQFQAASDQRQLEDCINDKVYFQDTNGKETKSTKITLEELKDLADEMLSSKLPLHVDEVKIYPDKMALSTLQFTERLGYKQENAVSMITMGCYNTLVTVRKRLESRENQDDETMDDQDQISLELVRKWIPGDRKSPKDWRCTREACAFYKRYCKYSQ